MKNLRNKNQPPNADLVQVYLQSSWDIVTAVYADLANIQTVADAINGGGLGNYLTIQDIDTLAELNAIVTDATLGDAADFATAAQGAKVDFLTVTQPVDLDAIEARVNELDQSVVLKGQWDASIGTFPGGGTAQAGESWIVSVAGTVDGIFFNTSDRIIAILDNASTVTYASNWHHADYTDVVTAVAGLTGNIGAVALRSALNIEDGATADQTGAEIKAAYEAEPDTNAFTDTLLGKLNGIEESATADQTDSEIKTAYEALTTLVSQAEAEAGVSTTVRLWTAQRVAQAIAALGGGGGGAGGLTPVFLDSGGAYGAAANDLILADTATDTAGVVLPSTPTDKDRIDVCGGFNAKAYPVSISTLGAETIDNVAAPFYIDQDWGQCRFIFRTSTNNWDIVPIGFPDLVNADDYFTKYRGQNLQTGTAYELVLNDAGKVVEMNNAAANTLTIPANSAVAFPVDTRIDVIQYGAGQTTIAITTDTLTGTATIGAQYQMVSLWKRAATEWVVIGGA